MLEDFKQFLVKANVIALALAVIVGAAAGALVTAMVDDFIMPIIGVITPGGNWREWTVGAGSLRFGIGHFLGALLNFAIVTFVAWQIGKLFIKPAPAGPPTKVCPFCKSTIPADASRCAACTSQL